jgi:hypothetical protein
VKLRPQRLPEMPRIATRLALTRCASDSTAGGEAGMIRSDDLGTVLRQHQLHLLQADLVADAQQGDAPDRPGIQVHAGGAGWHAQPQAAASETRLAWCGASAFPDRLTPCPARLPMLISPLSKATLACSPFGNISCIRPPPSGI